MSRRIENLCGCVHWLVVVFNIPLFSALGSPQSGLHIRCLPQGWPWPIVSPERSTRELYYNYQCNSWWDILAIFSRTLRTQESRKRQDGYLQLFPMGHWPTFYWPTDYVEFFIYLFQWYILPSPKGYYMLGNGIKQNLKKCFFKKKWGTCWIQASKGHLKQQGLSILPEHALAWMKQADPLQISALHIQWQTQIWVIVHCTLTRQ